MMMTDISNRTALNLSKEEWKIYRPVQVILQRQSAAHSQLERRRKRAMRLARQAAKVLREDYGARHVVLFGSFSSPVGFTLWSDIDLAVYGIPADRFYAAVAAITGLSAGFKVDTESAAPPSLQMPCAPCQTC